MVRRVSPILAATALILFAAPSSGAVPPSVEDRSVLRAEAFARLADVRRAVDEGSLSSAVRGAAALVRVPLEEMRTTTPSRAPDVPPGLAAPVTALLSAVHQAGSLAQQALRVPAGEVQRRADRFSLALGRSGGMVGRDAAELRPLRRFQGLAEELVDRSTLYSGALLLAEAIDANVPALAEYASTLPRAGAALGCEVADQPPVLCIGGTGANTYTAEYALVLDLGGDDVHSHSAGSADPQANGLPGAVTIDLGGNDTYASPAPAPSGALGVQGSGNVGGIGVLVDAAGNDTYTITGSDPVEQTLGQGFGVAGVGILADASGNDRYSIVGTPPAYTTGTAAERANGQAYGVIGAMTLALDGGGDDDYNIETRPVPAVGEDGILHPGNPITLGYGYSALSGPSIFSDAGGTDTMRIAARTETIPPEEARALELPTATAGSPGFGGLGGAGVGLTGAGSSTWTAEAEVRAPMTGLVSAGGTGTGALGGYGAFHDAGGADRYNSLATSVAGASRTTDETCACSGPKAEAIADRAVAGLGATGAVAGVGVIHEAGGADVYSAHAIGRAEAAAHDAVATPQEPRTARANASVGMVRTAGLGVGDLGSGGFFLDAGASDDTYTLLAESHAAASATADSTQTQLVTGEGQDFAESRSLGNGLISGGYGEFRDAGGSDTYSVVSRSTSSASEEGSTQTSAMGSASENGAALFVDAGGADTVTLIPEEPVCGGEPRGTGRYWQDCEGAAFGVNV